MKTESRNEFLNFRVFEESIGTDAAVKQEMGADSYKEGGAYQIPEQQEFYKTIAKDCKRILEIGFNTGSSSKAFLEGSSAKIVSFDLGTHDYIDSCKKDIDKQYPGRHTLILGDSTRTIPDYRDSCDGEIFDLILIDGAHDYENVKIDFLNCKSLADEKTVVILDDVCICPPLVEICPYLQGPTRVWSEAIKANEIIPMALAGEQYVSLARGMACFYYKF